MRVRFRTIGKWDEGDVVARWVEDGRRREPEVEREIERGWQEILHWDGVKLFDGPMCRLEQFRAARQLELDLSRTSYKIFWGTNLNHNEIWRVHGAEVMANAVGMSCALESAEGLLVLGRRSAAVAYYPGRVHPFAGSLEPGEAIDVFAEMRRELGEELHLQAGEVAGMNCLGIIEDASVLQPELVFEARCVLPRREMEERLNAEEHTACVWVEPTLDAVDWTLEKPELTPVAVGTVLLWGLGRFGREWFDARKVLA